MGLDPDPVPEVEAARARLLASQHAAEQARADYHHAIRRLQAAGGSLREIVEALRLSHRRSTRSSTKAPSRRGRGGAAVDNDRGGWRARFAVARVRSAPS
jgi:hypothetical protein